MTRIALRPSREVHRSITELTGSAKFAFEERIKDFLSRIRSIVELPRRQRTER